MGKTYHFKHGNPADERQKNKKDKFTDRRNKRRKVFTEKHQVMDTYIKPSEDEEELV